MSLAIGIDVGTADCSVAVFEAGRASALLVDRNIYREAAAVGASATNNALVVGDRARRLSLTQAPRMLLSGLRLLGQRFDAFDPEHWHPVPLQRAHNGDIAVQLGEHVAAPAEHLAALVRQVRHTCEVQLGEPVTSAVVLVRSHHSDATRRALLAACRLGGLEVRRLLHSTTAAALMYQTARTVIEDQAIVVVDVGAGGCDVGVFEVSEAGVDVLAHAGLRIGGDDFDARVVEWLLEVLREQTGIDGRAEPMIRARLRDASEKARIALSDTNQVEIHLPYLAADEAGPKHLHTTLTQAHLDKLTSDLLDRIVAALQRALDEAGHPVDHYTQVVLVGGCSRMPAIHERIETVLKKLPNTSLDAADRLARGAAIYAGTVAIRHPQRSVHETLSRRLWLQVGDAAPRLLFPQRSAVPTEHSEPVTTPGDGRPSSVCRILEGALAAGDAPELLRFTVSGRPEVEVKFTVDADQVLGLTIREVFRGKEARLDIDGRGGLDEAQLLAQIEANRVAEAEARSARERAETLRRLADMIHQAERRLTELERLTPDQREAIQAGIKAAQLALASASEEASEGGADDAVTPAIATFAAVLRGDQGAGSPRGWPAELTAIATPPAPVGRLQPAPAPARIVTTDADLDEAANTDDEDDV